MGYYVSGYSEDFRLKAGQDKAIMDQMRELNKRDDLKQGGSYGPNGAREYWFSWMNNADFDTNDIANFLEAVGFDYEKDENGDIIHLTYDSKIGQEDLFFAVMAPFIENGSKIHWRGEDYEQWGWKFEGGKMFIVTPVIDWNGGHKEEFTIPAE